MIPLQGYQAPEGIKEGVTNFVQNALLTPIKEGLYLEEGPKRYGQRLSNNLKAQEINLYNAQLDRRDNLITNNKRTNVFAFAFRNKFLN